MREYFWIMTVEATLPAGRGSTYGSGTISAEPPATRQDLFRTALTKVKEDARIPADAPVEVKFFYLEPNALPQP
ncbi:hypothetical protein [Streptomyces scabiei]|uniref:hypothetical protein n=1 Tax=Streptomyces scabiei TaxID=1930 RepID=UPI001B31084A|nr:MULTISPECIES: hypothetical protein [Streptomyces]MBP5870863.1 hypothetical protein [Streptomyces sp. LBUM 1485]MBP5913233.1 hypothetical protein [Streptomyces sp. LBUM 1486]MDX2532296.1 hypothetical protein [Streptomyces scabiei]MDX2794602.1 hypothetical protein [Streptomyces scabiei]MDX3822396.1 hypothetical protein [Streptomyces scabiei]